jgi:hypothetical protein
MANPTKHDLHEARFEALQEVFQNNIDHKVLLLTAQFPFLFIGTVIEVVSDFLRVEVETTHIDQLEGRTWLLHIDTISAFYIEKPGEPQIPELE